MNTCRCGGRVESSANRCRMCDARFARAKRAGVCAECSMPLGELHGAFCDFCRTARRSPTAPRWSDPAVVRAYMQTYYTENIEKWKGWRAAHPEAARDHDHRAAVKRRLRLEAAEIETFTRKEIIARDGGRCYLCGCSPAGLDLTLDHVVPLSRGGGHTRENVRVACRSCNSRKKDRSLDEVLSA